MVVLFLVDGGIMLLQTGRVEVLFVAGLEYTDKLVSFILQLNG
ncbi:MAG: hypothetical protein ACMG6E_08175 [Candidatus Roizmanbacteria bacterium]